MRLYQNVKLLLLLSMLILVTAMVIFFDEGADGISGNVVHTSVEVMPVSFRNCSFEMHPGWNMVSFYCLGLFSPRATVMSTVQDSYGSIFEYTANDPSGDKWKSYNPDLPVWAVQQLTNMDRISGYWIYMNEWANYSYSGIYSDSVIPLYDGWNLIGYPNTDSHNTTLVLNNISFTLVKNYHKTLSNMSVFDNSTNTTYNVSYYSGPDVWFVHINGSATNNLTTFETYKGYWIKVSGNQTLEIRR